MPFYSSNQQQYTPRHNAKDSTGNTSIFCCVCSHYELCGPVFFEVVDRWFLLTEPLLRDEDSLAKVDIEEPKERGFLWMTAKFPGDVGLRSRSQLVLTSKRYRSLEIFNLWQNKMQKLK